jgi:isopentenyl diphosphate isomerase/L-lactate dehydrogenase-like FMN-dependent dehydrogenase
VSAVISAVGSLNLLRRERTRFFFQGLRNPVLEGVEAVIRLMQAEFEMVMRQAGTPSIKKITSDYLVKAG